MLEFVVQRDLVNDMLLAHELTHALQDQHFNLRRFEKWPHGDSDAELAAHALIEGDATLMERFGCDIPVIYIGRKKAAKHRVNLEQFRRQLEDAS